MIFNDYVTGLNKQKDEIEKLQYIIDDLEKILKLHNEWVNDAFGRAYLKVMHNAFSNKPVQEANGLTERTLKYFDELRETIIGVDFLDFGEILGNFRNITMNGLEEKNERFYEKFRASYRVIHDYKKLTNVTERVNNYNNLIEAIYDMINIYENFMFMLDYFDAVNLGLNKGIEDDGFEIRLLNEGFDKDTYDQVTNPMYVIYGKLCEIAKLNSNSEPLEIIRMETGSFFIKFIGNKSILKVIAKFLESAHNLIIRNYTREGQKQNLVESTELLKDQLNIVNEMRELGLDVDEHYEVAKETLVMLMKQSNILLSSSPDVRINNKVLSKSEDIKKVLENKEFISLPINDEVV